MDISYLLSHIPTCPAEDIEKQAVFVHRKECLLANSSCIEQVAGKSFTLSLEAMFNMVDALNAQRPPAKEGWNYANCCCMLTSSVYKRVTSQRTGGKVKESEVFVPTALRSTCNEFDRRQHIADI